eukprot:9468303-Pyramimonas_sp.AAC.1
MRHRHRVQPRALQRHVSQCPVIVSPRDRRPTCPEDRRRRARLQVELPNNMGHASSAFDKNLEE